MWVLFDVYKLVYHTVNLVIAYAEHVYTFAPFHHFYPLAALFCSQPQRVFDCLGALI